LVDGASVSGISNVPAAPCTLRECAATSASAGGVQHTYCWRGTVSSEQPRVPPSSAAVSVTRSFHPPFTDLPAKLASGVSGLKLPAKGATPAEMAVAAESSNIVPVPLQLFVPPPKLSPAPPRVW